MKVGILTYHHGSNYGGVLQCLALQTAVRQLGHDAEVIDFHLTPPYKNPLWRGWQIHRHGFSCVPSRMIELRHGRKLLNEFDYFRQQQLKLSSRVEGLDALKEITSQYDAIITGSDQVWNFRCSPAYFLALGDSFTGRKIAYAPCCTQANQPENRIKQIGAWIGDYHAISVRDAFSKIAVERATGREARMVCDPTLLMAPQWLMEESAAPPKEHILVYRLGGPMAGDMGRFVRWLKLETGASRVEGIVTSTYNPHTSKETESRYFSLPPLQWVQKIGTARLVLTDSFHGAVFSMRMGVPFIAYCAEGERSPRLRDIAERFGVGNRIVTSSRDFKQINPEVLTQAADTCGFMPRHVSESWDFLRNALA